MCENVFSFVGDGGKRQTTMNCHNGKNCKFAHSREEVLYHPLLYKTILCEEANCCRYYCPFGHCVEELLSTNESVEYIKRCYRDVEIVEDESDQLDDDPLSMGIPDHEIILMDSSSGLRMRKASGQTALSGGHRLQLPQPGSSDWNMSEAWVSILPSLRIETVVRAHSPVTASELCRALVARSDAAKKTTSSIPNQYCLAKVMQFEKGAQVCDALLAELNTVGKTEHRNLLGVKKIFVGQMPGAGSSCRMLCLAFEQCSTSLYQAIVDGYRGQHESVLVRGLAKKLNPHTGTTTATAVQRIGEIVAGLQRLHFVGISHLRLCPTNVLIDNESCFKLGDFLGKHNLLTKQGLEKYLADSVAVWQAPELTEGVRAGTVATDNVELLRKADVYSLGCVVFYAMTGQHLSGTFSSPDKLGAGGLSANSSISPFIGGTETVLENMSSDYLSNQHLLYNCPLVLDLIFRCVALDPSHRLEVSDLSRHPLFWDFDFTKSFICSLPFGNPVLADFLRYELIWKSTVVAGSPLGDELLGCNSLADELRALAASEDYSETVEGVCRFMGDAWTFGVAFHKKSNTNSVVLSSFAPPTPAMMAPVTALWLRLLDRLPQILIRAWDGVKLSSMPGEKYFASPPEEVSLNKAFARNHLHWMTLRASATTSISHQFVREYYLAVSRGSLESLTFPDESAGLSDACIANSVSRKLTAASPNLSFDRRRNSSYVLGPTSSFPRNSPPMTPMVSAVNFDTPHVGSPAHQMSLVGTPGMTFVDPLIVKQMAAASAALSAIYDNAELVHAITKTGGVPSSQSQLVAAAAIYASLLENGQNDNQPDAAGAADSIW